MSEKNTSIDFKKIEQKWQDAWEKARAFQAKEGKARKFYCLEMFPYPSASYLHMGHVKCYSIGDLIARYKRMQGYNVLYPMGFDAFGLPAENAAIKEGTHPKEYTYNAIKNIKRLMKDLGLSYDWERSFATCDPQYYKWNQWIFLQMLKKGIAYRKKAPVNWCPSCKTVLANEEVIDGKCWRCNSQATIQQLEQWFLKITQYADELLNDLEKIDWPQKVKEMQRNWIGRSEGTRILFPLKASKESIEVFTTRPDTLFGVTFLVYAAQHLKVAQLVRGTKYEKEYQEFIKKTSASQKLDLDKEKEGFFTGSYALHPLTNEEIPIYASNFVVADYGTGAVMAVPAHDQRDFEFAKKYNIPIKEVIRPRYGEVNEKAEFRKTISAIVYRKKDGKFLLVKWKKFNWIAPVIGGIEEGETPQIAAQREVLEETGYTTKAIKKLGGEIESYFFAENKNLWRHRIDQPVLLEVIDDKPQKVENIEGAQHDALWMTAQEALEKITHEYNGIGIKRYLGEEGAYEGAGTLINSQGFNDLFSQEAKVHITKALEFKKAGGATTQYRLRDWLISRQRYWGTPFPIVYCDKCGTVPIPQKDLPVILPDNVKFTGKGNPLTTNKDFITAKCPSCGKSAKRETDTMATFFDSSWYFLRYCDPHNEKQIVDKKKVKYWMPVDQYIGGVEHAVLHLLYARFFTKFLRDNENIEIDEPFMRLFNQGILHKNGQRMSKSHGNTVTAEEISAKYGIDSARLFLFFVAGPEKDLEWDDNGIEGAFRIVNKFIALKDKRGGSPDAMLEHKLHSALKAIEYGYEHFEFNKSAIAFMEIVNYLADKKEVPDKILEPLVLASAPMMPHIAEELWSALGNKRMVVEQSWPTFDEKKIQEKFDAMEKSLDKTVADIANVLKILKEKQGIDAQTIYLYVLPHEKANYDASLLSRRSAKEVKIFAVNDPAKYDPQGKASKAKPGKPAIYVE